MNLYRPIIIGLYSITLTALERHWLRELSPYGVILFSRNVQTPEQLRELCASIRDHIGEDAVILIDQEGGRVQRLQSPFWCALPSALQIGRLWRKNRFKGLEAANSLGQIIGSQLAKSGITHTAAPVLDLHITGASQVIGDRSFGSTPAEIIPLATAFIDGLDRTGVTAIVKHIPGMGRAQSDSHVSLPVIDTPTKLLKQTDWLPFQKLKGKRWAMTTHAVIADWDHLPVTVSEKSIQSIHTILGDWSLISDCLTMDAISGSISERVQKTLTAGVDIALFSNGSNDERRLAVESAGPKSIARDERKFLQAIPENQHDRAVRKLSQIINENRSISDPTWDRQSI